jgi:hypothetical protein
MMRLFLSQALVWGWDTLLRCLKTCGAFTLLLRISIVNNIIMCATLPVRDFCDAQEVDGCKSAVLIAHANYNS